MTLASATVTNPKIRAANSAKGKAITPYPTKENIPSLFEAPRSVKKYVTFFRDVFYPNISSLRISLFLVAIASILRPTNLFIWFCIAMPTLSQLLSAKSRVSFNDKITFFREAITYSLLALLISAISDRLYYGFWTFPPYQWLTFNFSKDLAVFYGRNDWHYYLSQGLPLLLTTYTPFAIIGLWKTFKGAMTGIPFILATTILTTITTLSFISHKEVRFIYPLLPLLHLLAAPQVANFFYTTESIITHPPPFPSTPQLSTEPTLRRKPILLLIILLNTALSIYTTLFHQSGVQTVLPYLRQQYEEVALDVRGIPLNVNDPRANAHALFNIPKSTDFDPTETFVGFLMPCHSTPWRSKLFYPGLKAWALGCEPPLELPAGSAERFGYRDEADRFFDDPVRFLQTEANTREKPWPRYIVGFEGIAEPLRKYYEEEVPGFRVREKWRTGISHWHDDPRRRGDVVVWEFVDGSKEK